MVVCVAVTGDGMVAHRWARAERVALADVTPAGIGSWREIDVDWGRLRETGTEGSHHARVARFIRENHVEAVAARHIGADMEHMLGKLGVAVRLGASGNARQAALHAAENPSLEA
jgi:predicted Fe-Mo cluster-binding NifX family protein